MPDNLILGVVGHTNTGKTSLMRTLLRNSHFGAVKNQAGTTRHVEAANIRINSEHALELRDTPGLEDSSALRHHLLSFEQNGFKGKESLKACIQNGPANPEFEQEIKVLKQTLECHLLLYVVDSREPIFDKYLDEIHILQLAAIPILPVLNFIHSSTSQVEQWKSELAQLGLHAHVAFDTVAYAFEAEKRLYSKLQTLLESRYDLLQELIQKRQDDWQQLQKTIALRISHLLYDVCALSVPLPAPGPTDSPKESSSSALKHIQDQTRALEKKTLQAILSIMQFESDDVALSTLPVSNGQWQLDLFAPETLKTLGLDTASAAATGAAIGVGVDLLFAGMSLGAATATGAALGAAWHTSKRFGSSLLDKLKGKQVLSVDDLTLDTLLLRQIWLAQTVFHRGHAALNPSQLEGKPALQLPKDWPSIRQKFRASAAHLGLSEEDAIEQGTRWVNDLLNAQETSFS